MEAALSRFRCFDCHCTDLDDAPELQGNEMSLHQLSFARGDWSEEVVERKPSLASKPREELKAMMKTFAERGAQGVPILLFDEFSGVLCPGMYQLDEQLQTLQFLPEDTADSCPYGTPVQTAQVDQVLEVHQSTEAIHHVEPGAWKELSEEERSRLLVLVYQIEAPDRLAAIDCRKVCFLEVDCESSRMFATCIRILRRYFRETQQSLREI
ncbi:unnamed protein product [Effrenium voratum]|uniref:Uncharacterized protein n=1 Tax=Effrenium voratum TaxID=2562239 RepID=A0AA36NFU8_9DINO|nr:unnamed protein product [Effrenium voratum]CAJ1441180.1 unnamed protein product [Effrenium voratum]